ncbi:phage Gp37/Gp68 family protein [Microvirga arsenatis]|uniref:DUF5131 family protein n=1 Tax=Microvirga arsenatis TaxID=2692265 RepID=A0ABW9YXR4_9HYPH|nr:phage Gp37/Gp68 family protein [Microvirga arsenatis]NBJ13238.1 DUF5131 family protein [Microvirga arsenatis]NBJ25124.1 DUF5131 family protein [Microvirga arsenatis]
MGDKSAIEWTNATWNPIAGCSVISPGCANCYAMKMASRLVGMGVETYAGLTKDSNAGPVWTGAVRLVKDALLKPLRWKRPRRIFVNSMSDLFHEAVPDEWIDRIFAVMALAPQHTFQVLTKRADRMRAYLEDCRRQNGRQHLIRAAITDLAGSRNAPGVTEAWLRISGAEENWSPLRNVWLGVSAEDQTRANERIPDLLATPAAVRWVSAEPLLGPIDFMRINRPAPLGSMSALLCEEDQRAWLNWIVVGGESGPGARPMHPDWARSIRDQCATAGVPFFFKQWGNYLPAGQCMADGRPWSPVGGPSLHAVKALTGRLLDGVEHNQYPGASK